MSRSAVWARLPLLLAGAATLTSSASQAHAYALYGGAWRTGTISLKLQLDATAPASPTFPLRDGSTSWNSVAQAAIGDWNASGVLSRCTLVGTTSTDTTAKEGDGTTNVLFSNTAYGQAFDSRTLAVTFVDNLDSDGLPTVRIQEADLIVNNARTWNSYRGRIQSTPTDLRRVLLHELGHVLGLDHPDEAVPAQSVAAIMNSTISDLETLQTDDRNGIQYLYSTPLPVVTITRQPTNLTASVTDATGFTFGVNGATTPLAPIPALLSYTWYFKATGATSFEPLFTVTTPQLPFGTVQLADAGSYYVVAMTPDATVTSNTVNLTVNPVTTSTITSLANLSNRGIAGGTTTLQVGFVVTGAQSKSVLLRVVGPTLKNFAVAGTLPDPLVTLTKLDGTKVATSGTTWDGAANATDIVATAQRVGAFPLQAGSRDAVILTSIAPGGYTAQVSSVSGDSGVVLVEAYDADTATSPASRLANLSTRGYVGTGDNVLIAGFVVRGPGPRTYLIRVAGPTLTTFGVTNPLPDPMLALYGANSVLLRNDDDWDTPSAAQPALKAAFTQVGAFNLTDRVESAMLVTLPPGSYSAQASGNDNANSGQPTSPVGNAIIEIYEIP